jgi:hypothetical protein
MAISDLSIEELQRLTPEDLDDLTIAELRQAYPRLTLEQQKVAQQLDPQWTSEQESAALGFCFPAYRLTPEEERRRAYALTLADASLWRRIAESCIPLIVESYSRSDVDMKGVLAATQLAAIGCSAQDRVTLLGETAVLALRQKPRKRKRGQTSPRWPLWVQRATADLVLWEAEQKHGIRRSPRPGYSEADIVKEPEDGTSVPISKAINTLTSLGWFGTRAAPKPSTVDDWVRARQNAATALNPPMI